MTALRILREGEIEIVGRIVGSSNNAMLATVTVPCPEPEPAESIHAVYKPTAGERPLDRLSRRHAVPARGRGVARVRGARVGHRPAERAARRAVRRGHGPAVDRARSDRRRGRDDRVGRSAPATDRGLRCGREQHRPQGRSPAAGRWRAHVFGVDHGVCFSPVPKLRTVLWGWRGDPLRRRGAGGVRPAVRRAHRGVGSDPPRSADVHRGRSDAATGRGPARDASLADAVTALAGRALAAVLGRIGQRGSTDTTARPAFDNVSGAGSSSGLATTSEAPIRCAYSMRLSGLSVSGSQP